MNQLCSHRTFICESVDVIGSDIKICIVRCTQCGTAIGAFLPQIPDTLNALGAKLDALQRDVQKFLP